MRNLQRIGGARQWPQHASASYLSSLGGGLSDSAIKAQWPERAQVFADAHASLDRLLLDKGSAAKLKQMGDVDKDVAA